VSSWSQVLMMLASGCIVVGSPPQIEELSLSPMPVTDSKPVTAQVLATDADGDTVTLTYRWYINGGLLAEAGDSLSNEHFVRGDSVRLEVVPSDPYQSGALAAVEQIVQNAPPGAPVAQILPADAVWGRDALTCSAATPSVDPDGDPVTYREIWTADGVPFGGPVRGIDTTLARQWSCSLVPSDGTGEGPPGQASLSPAPSLSNVLVLLVDDMGNDRPAFTGQHPVPSVTPNLDRLADEGVYFPNMYVSPLCSPSRAMAFTGRYPRRTGIGYIVDHWLWQVELSPSEITVPEAMKLGPAPYASSFAGKFHMSSAVSGPASPLQHGLDWYAGTLGNPLDPPGVGYGWFEWERDNNGELEVSTAYVTTDSADDALDRMNAMPEPWLMWVSFNAVHTPVHRPPEALTPLTTPGQDAGDFEKHTAVLEALDTEIGRMLNGLPADLRQRTTVVMFGDNGTDKEGIVEPWDRDRAKGTPYEAGVNVPLVIWGPLVESPGTEVDAFVHAVDILPTLATIAGVDTRELGVRLDGHNLLPFLADPEAPVVRDYVYTENFSIEVPGSEGRRDRDDTWRANGRPPYAFEQQMVRDARYKLVRLEEDGVERYELFDLEGQDIEGDDLLAAPLDPDAQAAYDQLYALLQAELADQIYDVPNQPVYLADARIEPAQASAGQDLTCSVGRAIDGDDDPVVLSYRWTVGGTALPDTTATLPAGSFSFGADVRCVVSGTDESGVPTELEAVATWGA
jgi:arylsulfatase A-like enzyme